MKSPSMTLDTPNGDLDHGHASGERLRIYCAEVAACSALHPVAGDLDSAAIRTEGRPPLGVLCGYRT